jgi:hypothetical protein
MYCLLCTACYVLPAMHCLSCTACHALPVMYCLSCTACYEPHQELTSLSSRSAA